MNNRKPWYYDTDKLKPLSCIVLFITGLALAIYSIIAPPEGVIDSSVLTYTGEALAYIAAIMGVEIIRLKNK
jgi:hypothetical protein